MVLNRKTGFVRLRLQFLASTLVMIVKGDPVSIKAVGFGGSAYSRPILLPYSMSSANLVTENRMHGPGSSGSNGFQGKLNVAMLKHEIHWFRLPNLLDEKVAVLSKFSHACDEGIFVGVEEVRQNGAAADHDEFPEMG
jgi:hypothetical protein